MQTPSIEELHSWSQFAKGPIQSLASWHSRAQLSMLRLDLLQSWASGNKYYKLKYALEFALTNGVKTIVSKGGMFSNHLAALGDACVALDLRLVAVIRSFAPDENNPSVQKLRKSGCEIVYVTPALYASFDATDAERLYPGALFVPEGGLSELGIRGTSEIVKEFQQTNFTHIIISGGSMGTACGLISTAPVDTKVIVVPAWKGCTNEYVKNILQHYDITPVCSWEQWSDYHFGGFGRFNQQLIDFMRSFSSDTGIPLDPVYTGKMMYAVDEHWKSNYFKDSDSILAIHTGGLQGLEGYRYRFPKEWGSYIK